MFSITTWILIYVLSLLIPILLLFPWGDGFAGDAQLLGLVLLPPLLIGVTICIHTVVTIYSAYTNGIATSFVIQSIALIIVVLVFVGSIVHFENKRTASEWTLHPYRVADSFGMAILGFIEATEEKLRGTSTQTGTTSRDSVETAYQRDANAQTTDNSDTAITQTIGPDGQPSIYWTIKEEDRNKIIDLLDAGVDVDVEGAFRSTPALAAARIDDWKTVELLLSRGADITAHDTRGITLPYLAHTSRVDIEGSYGEALLRVREKIANAGIEHWSAYSVQEVKEMLANDTWPPTAEEAASKLSSPTTHSTPADTSPHNRMTNYLASSYSSVELDVKTIIETDEYLIYQTNLQDASNTFFMYFVVPTDSAQPIMPTTDISKYRN